MNLFNKNITVSFLDRREDTHLGVEASYNADWNHLHASSEGGVSYTVLHTSPPSYINVFRGDGVRFSHPRQVQCRLSRPEEARRRRLETGLVLLRRRENKNDDDNLLYKRNDPPVASLRLYRATTKRQSHSDRRPSKRFHVRKERERPYSERRVPPLRSPSLRRRHRRRRRPILLSVRYARSISSPAAAVSRSAFVKAASPTLYGPSNSTNRPSSRFVEITPARRSFRRTATIFCAW